jgi:hypothetical protein
MEEPVQISKEDIYQNYKLPPGSNFIRVLDILPVYSVTPDLDAEPLKCVLSTINLDDSPKFTALSYVWGEDPPTPQYFILCGEFQVKVTANCYSALRHLRNKLGKFRIWVDAICIDQANLVEKLQQVPLMGDIFSSAELVYIWLGEGTDGTDRAMQYFAKNEFGNLYEKSSPLAAAWSLFISQWSWTRNPLPLGKRKPWNKRAVYTTCGDLKELFSRPWIDRVWTFQELLLATHPIVVCGNAHVSWSLIEPNLQLFITLSDLKAISTSWHSVAKSRTRLQTLSHASQTLAIPNWKKHGSFSRRVKRINDVVETTAALLSILSIGFLVPYTAISFVDRKYWQGGAIIVIIIILVVVLLPILSSLRSMLYQVKSVTTHNSTTNELLTALYSRRAKDPKDMAFGLWAVLDRRAGKKLKLPGYSHNTGDVYRDFTVHLANITNSMDFLLYAAARNYPGQPSWVPDWTASEKHIWASKVGEIRTSDDYGNRVNYHTRHVFSSRVIVNRIRSVITVSAYNVATISMCVKIRKTSDTFRDTERNIHLENARYIYIYEATRPILNELEIVQFTFIFIITGFVGILLAIVYLPDILFRLVMRRCHSKSPPEILALLTSKAFALPPLCSVTKTYIRRCNELAERKKALFLAQYPSAPTTICYGKCSFKAEIGDKILRVQGLPQLLLVRPVPGRTKAVTIVSPVELDGALVNRRKIPPSNDFESAERYTEYDIH